MKKVLDVVRRFFSRFLRKEIVAEETEEKTKKHVRRIRRKAIRMDLIRCIEVAFESVVGRVHRGTSWVHPDTRKAIRKIGPWCPYSIGMKKSGADEWRPTSKTNIRLRKKFPSIFVIDHGWIPDKNTQEDMVAQDLSYAIKLEKPPWDVFFGRNSKNYVFYEHGRKFGQRDTQWVNCYLSINKRTGRVEPLVRLYNRPITVPKRNGKPLTYSRHEWVEPLAQHAPETWGKTEKERIDKIRADFIEDFEWWTAREKRWSASARKGNDRVTFSVEKEDTKYFFADRDRTALTSSGQRKKIIHFVRQHERRVKGKIVTVREHIRGLRSFVWNGCEVNVTAPEFHSFAVQKFDIPSLDESDMLPGEKALPASRWAEDLARLEDGDNRKLTQ